MSNKRNPRRRRQRVRSEVNRKPGPVTKGMTAFIAGSPLTTIRGRQWARKAFKFLTEGTTE